MFSVSSQAQEEPQQPAEEVKPLIQEEIKQGMAEMQQRLNDRIEAWGKTLTKEDFEWSWRGRILNQPKRQEVCNIFQGVVNETYRLAVQNKARLSPESQEVLKDRNVFIERLGYKDNIVDTRMGFNCRLK
ncbi:hypothetical protein BS636_09085 [Acinetobacter sp. LoGeW2-3]|uniref:hypothetical protein n=1 Tax=Acinetobacter sp. LoGeW2-3 TaxID=1808001 RepID=UPI000C05AE4A|nr:hypothetical protein [Acinetobacter sp. LoGeW2-3]ATO21041.1 hypothetical protein BS636_09085 [Acinetobacter sp. LoGeW2-3]